MVSLAPRVLNRTWQCAAEHLGSQADGSVLEPGLRVDPNVARHCGLGEDGQHRGFSVPVPLKHLLAPKITFSGPLQLS